MVDVSREVLIALKLVPDKGNAAVLRDMAKVGVGAHQTITVAAENSAAAQAKAHKKAQADIVRESQNAARKAASEQQKLEKALLASAGGAIALAKGLAQVGLAGEKDAEKLLQGLVAIEGAFGVIKGGLGILSNIRKAQDAYTASVAATALAQKAAAVAGVAGAAGSAAAGGGGLAAAGAALVGGPVGIAVTGIVAAGAAALYFANETRKAAEEQEKKRVERAKNNERETDEGISRTAQITGGRRADEDALSAAKAELAAMRNSRLSGNPMREGDVASAQATAMAAKLSERMANALSERQVLLNKQKTGTDADAQGTAAYFAANAKEIESLGRQQLDLKRQEFAIAKQQQQTAQQMAREQLDLQKQQLQTARQRIQEEEDKLRSAEEKFANLAPDQAGRAVEAARKARSGERLTDADRKSLEESGIGSVDDSVRAGAQADSARRVKELGGDEFFREQRERIERFKEAEADLREQTIDTEAVISKLSKEAEKSAEKMTADLIKIIEAVSAARERAVNAEAAKAQINSRVQQSTVAES